MKSNWTLLLMVFWVINFSRPCFAQYTGGVGRGDVSEAIFTTPGGGSAFSVSGILGPYCAGETFLVSFSSFQTFNIGNVFTAELSDDLGSFSTPFVVGSLGSSANLGNISVTIPGGTLGASGFRMRIVSSNPADTSSTSSTFVINTALTPSVSIVANPGNSICAGTSVTFTATPTNGGASPSYQWQVNGSNVGSNSATYTSSSLTNGQTVTCILTSNDACASPTTATGNSISMTVYNNVTPSVSISTYPGSTICAGTSVTFTATPINGGASPSYQWQVNGNDVDTGATFTASSLANGDVVTCIMTSSDLCASPVNVTSNPIAMTVVNLPLPQYTITNNNLTTEPLTAEFNNSSVVAGLQYTWNFGDGYTLQDNGNTVFHTYQSNGVYHTGLSVLDPASGCQRSNFDPGNTAQQVICNAPGANGCGFTATTNPSGNFNTCIGGSVTIQASGYPSNAVLQWYRNGVILGGEVFGTLGVQTSGWYNFSATLPDGCSQISAPVQLNFNQNTGAAPVITVTGNNGQCGVVNATLTASGGFAQYLWSNGASGSSISVNTPGNYSVIGQSAGCDLQSAPVAVTSSVLPARAWCMITVEPASNHPVVVWEKPIVADIDSYYVYREIPYNSGLYTRIASVAYEDLSEYEDIDVDGNLGPQRYTLSILDTCGGESSPSQPGSAIFLSVGPGMGVRRVLSWSAYASSGNNSGYYLIYSGTNPTALNLIDSVPGIQGYYEDITPVAGVNTLYRVEKRLSVSCESTRASRTTSKSNSAGNLIENNTSLKERVGEQIEIQIMPNPSNGEFKVILNKEWPGAKYWLEDLSGRSLSSPQPVMGTLIEFNEYLPAGVYLLRWSHAGMTISKRLIISRG